jgi:hypothetical protein
MAQNQAGTIQPAAAESGVRRTLVSLGGGRRQAPRQAADGTVPTATRAHR